MIIGVDINPAKKQWGERFGMTHFVNPKEVGGDLVAHACQHEKRGADQSAAPDYTYRLHRQCQRHAAGPGGVHRGGVSPSIIGVAPAGAESPPDRSNWVTAGSEGTAFGARAAAPTCSKSSIGTWMARSDPMITTMALANINRGSS